MNYDFIGLMPALLPFVILLATASPGSPSGREGVEVGTAVKISIGGIFPESGSGTRAVTYRPYLMGVATVD